VKCLDGGRFGIHGHGCGSSGCLCGGKVTKKRIGWCMIVVMLRLLLWLTWSLANKAGGSLGVAMVDVHGGCSIAGDGLLFPPLDCLV